MCGPIPEHEKLKFHKVICLDINFLLTLGWIYFQTIYHSIFGHQISSKGLLHYFSWHLEPKQQQKSHIVQRCLNPQSIHQNKKTDKLKGIVKKDTPSKIMYRVWQGKTQPSRLISMSRSGLWPPCDEPCSG